MKKKRIYCSYCGALLTTKLIDDKYRDFCTNCNTTFYENPLPVASCIVINQNREVLLVQRKHDPYKYQWCLPIGFAETGETLEQAALRELKEEAGVDGEIVRIIDVDTVENYYYGDLAIITFEVKQLSQTIQPGDDALDARFFPLSNHPPLAWQSNEKALQKFIELYTDVWNLLDSIKSLDLDIMTHHDVPTEKQKQFHLIAKIIINFIDSNTNLFDFNCRNYFSVYDSYIQSLFSEIHTKALTTMKQWLDGKRVWRNFREFYSIGTILRHHCVSLKEILRVIALSRKILWMHVVENKLIHPPLDVYATLEINNRIIQFYDKITYFIMRGYEHH